MPVINTQITETTNITENGTYDVARYTTAVVNTPAAPELYREFQVDERWHTFSSSTTTTKIIDLTGVKQIENFTLCGAYMDNKAISGVVDMSTVEHIRGNYGCAYMFSGCSGITSVDLSSLKRVNDGNGGNGCQGMFMYCSGLTTVNLSSLEKIGTNSCQYMFQGCSNIAGPLDLSSLTTVPGSSGCQYMFNQCSKITSVDLSSLTTVSGNCNTMFGSCTSLTSIDLCSLSSITGWSALTDMFKDCTSLTRLSFYALNENSFGNNNVLDNIIRNVDGCTVHFPIRVQSKIGSWSSVVNGLGGTNTTVLFDIVCTLTGVDTNTYTRSQKNSTSTVTAWDNGGTLYYTSGTTEPTVGTTIYSDAACTTVVTTIDSMA